MNFLSSNNLNSIKVGIYYFKNYLNDITNQKLLDLYYKGYLNILQKILELYYPVESVVVNTNIYEFLKL